MANRYNYVTVISLKGASEGIWMIKGGSSFLTMCEGLY